MTACIVSSENVSSIKPPGVLSRRTTRFWILIKLVRGEQLQAAWREAAHSQKRSSGPGEHLGQVKMPLWEKDS